MRRTLTEEGQKIMLKRIAEAMRKPNADFEKLDAILGKVLQMELPEEDPELVGEWERLTRER